MNLKNSCILGLLRLIPVRRKSAPHANILIVSTTGLGDTLWGTPAIRALREMHPHAHIAMLTSPIGAQVVANSPHLDAVHIVKDPAIRSLFRAYRKLKRRHFDTAYIFHTSQRPILPFIHLLGPSRIIGTSGINKGLDRLLTDPRPQKHQHEIMRRLDLVGAPTHTVAMEIAVEPLDPFEEPVIAMHIGANAPFKQWPIERFVSIGQKLAAHKFRIVITGSASEFSQMQLAAGQIPGAKLWMGSLPSLAGLLKQTTLFITNDTGPLHIAIAVGAPTIALFGPTDPSLCGPLDAPHVRVIQAQPTCSYCLKQRCRDPFCMRQISVSAVWRALEERLDFSAESNRLGVIIS